MPLDDLSHIWIGTTAGELVRADAIIGLLRNGGSADAHCSDGRTVRLADSRCPADFHVQLLQELAHDRADARWLLIIGAESARDRIRWTLRRVDDIS